MMRILRDRVARRRKAEAREHSHTAGQNLGSTEAHRHRGTGAQGHRDTGAQGCKGTGSQRNRGTEARRHAKEWSDGAT